MPRILFVVNEHPNEAFAISVARETAKLLRAKGQEIIWKKFPFRETMLGRALKEDAAKVIFPAFLDSTHRARLIQGWIRQENPSLVYKFHCTPAEHAYWAEVNPGKDFVIEADSEPNRAFEKPSFLIEIKAKFAKFPERVLRKVGAPVDGTYMNGVVWAPYLTITTSQQLSRKAGLTPEKFGKAIARVIGMHAKQQRKMLALQNISGRILRAPKKRLAKIRQRPV